MADAAQVGQAAAGEGAGEPEVAHAVAVFHFARDATDASRLVDLSGQILFDGTQTRMVCCCWAHSRTVSQQGQARLFDPAQQDPDRLLSNIAQPGLPPEGGSYRVD